MIQTGAGVGEMPEDPTISRYREKRDQAKAAAELAPDDEIRTTFLHIASDYEFLIEVRERLLRLRSTIC